MEPSRIATLSHCLADTCLLAVPMDESLCNRMLLCDCPRYPPVGLTQEGAGQESKVDPLPPLLFLPGGGPAKVVYSSFTMVPATCTSLEVQNTGLGE